MARFSLRFILMVAAGAVIIFIVAIMRMMTFLNFTDKEAYHSLPDCTSCNKDNQQRTIELEEEIEILRHQIRSLEATHYTSKQQTSGPMSKLTDDCLRQIDFTAKLSNSDASGGHSYPSERHVPTYIRFDMWYMHHNMKAASKLTGVQRKHVDEVIDEAVLSIGDVKWRRDHFIEGLYYMMETVGTHYILYFLNDNNEQRQVTLFRPQPPPIPISHHAVEGSRFINIVVPLYKRGDTFIQFLINFEQILSRARPQIYLTLVYFGDSIKDLMSVFQPFILKHSYRSYHVEHVKGETFSRGYALDVGIRRWKGREDPLLFLCDVDVVFDEGFIDRCSSYAQKHRQVYYPIVFSLYNPQVVENYLDRKLNNLKDKLKVTSSHGFWRDFGYGMACLYRSDYIDSGGFVLDLKEWGEEDILLFRKFAQSNLTVIRAPDPNIFHTWHEKVCNRSLSALHYEQCIKSKVLNEGSQAELGNLLLANGHS